MLCPGHPDWSQYYMIDTHYVESLPWVSAYYQASPVEGLIEDLLEDDDNLDYEPMEAELREEEAMTRAMDISKAKERAKWASLEEAIQCSQQEATPTPASPAPEDLPPVPLSVNVWPSLQVFINLDDKD
jgi:hypothetical protein